MYKLTLNMPHLAEGAEIQVPELGVFTVGGDNEISDEQAAAYESSHVEHEPAYADVDGEQVQVGVQQVHKTLEELINGKFSGVSVELVSAVGGSEEESSEENSNESNGMQLSLNLGGAS